MEGATQHSHHTQNSATIGVKCFVNYGYQFSQLPIFKKYIKMCQEMRKIANPQLKKIMERFSKYNFLVKLLKNILNYTDVKYVNTTSQLKRLMSGLGPPSYNFYGDRKFSTYGNTV